jgi:uncharacterized protein (TIGR03067 family)
MNGQFTISLQFLTTYLASRMKLEAMKIFRHIITIVCIVASLIATAGELTTGAKWAVNHPVNAELKLLQGKWEGVLVGDQAHQKITVTITGNSLYFHRDANFWFDTTIILPPGKDPKQLHATIKACPPPQADSIGKVVRAFVKIEQETLILATIGDDAEETPTSFEGAGTRYELHKVQPQEKNTEPPKTK